MLNLTLLLLNITIHENMTFYIPVALCKRNFSKIKLIKNCLRLTRKLNNLAMQTINEAAKSIPLEGAISEFVAVKARKIRFLKQSFFTYLAIIAVLGKAMLPMHCFDLINTVLHSIA